MSLSKSWVVSANEPTCPFPLSNLPFGVFSNGDSPRCGTAIGDRVVDLAALETLGLLPRSGFDEPALNTFMSRGPQAWAKVRARLTSLLGEHSGRFDGIAAALRTIADVTLHMPFAVAGYTDFYAGRQHASNVGTMLRGADNALPPNWLHIPIGYNGRASTVVVSGTAIRRPLGQTKAPDAASPSFGPTRRLDFELEMGAVVGVPSRMGHPVTVAEADDMIFGFVLLNDWSARDIQAWEYQPLGPFQAKAFATKISPWLVTKAALEPFRCATPAREKELLPYLHEPGPMNYEIALGVTMQARGGGPTMIARTNARELYYSFAQQLAHHAISGCKMNPGDLLGSGTISGPDKDSFGSLLELTWGGKEPLTLNGGATRRFIEDGDTLILHGHADGDGYRIGFGDCAGTILPAPTFPN